MPITLKGSCRCGAVGFSCGSHTPQPYQRCYCSICRKTAGGGGYAINLMGNVASLRIDNPSQALTIYQAEICDDAGVCEISTGQRNFCMLCASALWLWDPTWPDLLHPFASAIDSDLPVPPASVHLMLDFKPAWVVPQIGPSDQTFARYPDQSIEDWHKSRGLWVD